MSHIETEKYAPGQRVIGIKIIGANRIIFHAQSKELALNCINTFGTYAQTIVKNSIQCLHQTLAGRPPVSGMVFGTIGNPVIVDNFIPQRFPNGFRNAAARNTVLNPEIANIFIGMAQSKAIIRFGMCKICWIKINADIMRLCPIDPARKVLRLQGVAIDDFATRITIRGVDIRSVWPGQQINHFFQVSAKLIPTTRATGIIARSHNAATFNGFIFDFKTRHIVTLPAMERDRHFECSIHSPFNIHAKGGVLFGSVLEIGFNLNIGNRCFIMH